MQTKVNEIGRAWAKKLRGEYDRNTSYTDLIKLFSPIITDSTTHLDLSKNWSFSSLGKNPLNAGQLNAIVSFFRSFSYNLNTLDLSKNDLLLPHLSQLFGCIPSPITVLKLQAMTTKPGENSLLIKAIDAIPDSVTELDVSDNQFQGEEVRELFNVLAKKKNITKVTLSDRDINNLDERELSELAGLVPHIRQVDAVEPDRGPSWSSHAAAKLNQFLKNNAAQARNKYFRVPSGDGVAPVLMATQVGLITPQKIGPILLAVERLNTHATTLLRSTDTDTVEKGQVALNIAKNISEKTFALGQSLNTPKEKECYEELNQALLGGLNEMSSHRNLFKWLITLVTEFLGIRPALAQRNSFFPETNRQKLVHEIKEELDTQFPANSPQTK